MDVAEPKPQGEATEPSQTTTPAKSFLDLPVETQHQIVGHCSQSDLICLALVSSHFRDLAAAQLYRHFHIVFPDDDDPAFDSPIDSLAGGLETFVTGEYDYAQHMRELLLDTLSVGGKAENAYKPYLYSLSCGKFMNTLLLLTLRRATSLETFHWNIRVELSRQVYRALHQMPSLRHLHLRLQAGPSLFEVPPPLPYSPAPSIAHTAPTASYWHSGADATLSTSSVSSGFLPYGTPASLPSPKAVAPKNRRKTTIDIDPPTISGFKKLKTLSILDIDSLELVTEIKACIRNSSLTLNKLKLSFSSRLATQARKPRARDLDDDDDDPDDDFQVVPLPAPSSSWDDAAPSVVAFRAQQERKAQEAVLGRIFDLEHYLVKKEPQSLAPEKEKTVVSETAVPAAGEPSLPAQLFMDRLKEVSDRLALETEEGLDLDPATKQEILSSIHKAAKKYIEAMDAPAAPTAGPADKTEAEPTTEGQVKTETKDATEAKSTTKTTFQTSDKVSSPDDIDIEAPITTEDSDEATEQPALPEAAEKPAEKTREKDQVPSAAVIRASLTLEVQKENFSKVVAQLQKLKDQATDLQNELVTMHDNGGLASDIANLEKKVAEYGLWIRSNQEELEIVRREIQDAAKQAGVDTTEEEREFARISDYIKSTRGIPLRSFSVYLMPLKASTLRDAVDLQALHKLTLLNVGSQTGIWAMLARENRKRALPLRKIFTDHASKVFLACVKQLDRVDELYMLERSESYKPESFAPKAGTTMQDIRRAVLKKHLTTLRRLVIKNDADTAWDADEKTVFLLCNRGARLEELAVSLNIRSMHTLMQNVPQLVKLRALHIPHFRSNDTCPWVMRETRRFLVDAVSHHPHLKLEWLAIDDDSVVRIVRNKDKEGRKDQKEKEKEKEKKKKDKAAAAAGVGGTNPIWMEAGYPSMQLQQKLIDELSSDSEDDEVESRLETIENIRFYDVWGVRMFKKEMMAGQL